MFLLQGEYGGTRSPLTSIGEWMWVVRDFVVSPMLWTSRVLVVSNWRVVPCAPPAIRHTANLLCSECVGPGSRASLVFVGCRRSGNASCWSAGSDTALAVNQGSSRVVGELPVPAFGEYGAITPGSFAW